MHERKAPSKILLTGSSLMVGFLMTREQPCAGRSPRAAMPLWQNMSLMEECRRSVSRALEAGQISDRQRMVLLTALGVALYSIGPKPETKSAWTDVLRIADA